MPTLHWTQALVGYAHALSPLDPRYNLSSYLMVWNIDEDPSLSHKPLGSGPVVLSPSLSVNQNFLIIFLNYWYKLKNSWYRKLFKAVINVPLYVTFTVISQVCESQPKQLLEE
jgi:hypothetical protein